LFGFFNSTFLEFLDLEYGFVGVEKMHIIVHKSDEVTALIIQWQVEKLVSVDASPIHKTTPDGIKQIRLLLDAVRKTELQKHFKNEQSET